MKVYVISVGAQVLQPVTTSWWRSGTLLTKYDTLNINNVFAIRRLQSNPVTTA